MIMHPVVIKNKNGNVLGPVLSSYLELPMEYLSGNDSV